MLGLIRVTPMQDTLSLDSDWLRPDHKVKWKLLIGYLMVSVKDRERQ